MLMSAMTLAGQAVGKSSSPRQIAGGNGSKRSVLALLTRARAIQQKEQELIDIYQDVPVQG